MADPEEKIASVIVPDYQLSLAIGKEGRMHVLLQDLQDIRLILRARHRR